MHQSSPNTTIKPLLIAVCLPLAVILTVSNFLTPAFLSLDASIGRQLYWLVPDLLLLAGAALFSFSALLATTDKPKLHNTIFVTSILALLLCGSLELTSVNFAHVTGSLLDGAMLSYAIINAEESWTLVNESTPLFLKVLMAIGAVISLTAPFVLRKKLSPLIVQIKPLILAGAALLLMLVPSVAMYLTPRQYNAAFPNVCSLISSSLRTKNNTTGTATARAYYSKNTTLKKVSKPRNVVLILLESTRASATTPYNPELETTPFLKELSEKSLLAEHAYSVVPHTSKAVITTGCGVEPYLGLAILEKSDAGIPSNCMANLFSKQGYATAFFQSATQTFEGRANAVKNMGFKEFYPLEKLNKKGFEKANYFGPEDNVMLKPSVEWAKNSKNSKKPFFITYLTVTPHHGYLAPKRYGRKTYSSKKMFNRYLNSVNYVDHFVKNVFDEFKKNGLYEDTVFAIVGDHGEGFGEHKRYQHDKLLYNEGLQVPLIIHDPKNQKQVKVSAPVSQVDIAPTLINLSGHTLEHGTLPGYNLYNPVPEDRKIYTYCWAADYCIGLVHGQMKYIHHYDRIGDQVFDMTADPDEKHPLSDQLGNYSLQELLDWRASVNQVYENNHASYKQEFITTTKPSPQVNTSVKFGDSLELIGYSLSPSKTLQKNQPVTMTLFFKTLKTPPKNVHLFVHGIDAKGKYKNFDHTPVEGSLPVEEFPADHYIVDRHTFFLPKKVNTGKFHFNIGLWNKSTKKRLKASQDGKPLKKNIFKIQNLNVK